MINSPLTPAPSPPKRGRGEEESFFTGPRLPPPPRMTSLESSVRSCREIVDRSGSSFRRSFEFLDAEARSAMEAVYAFARLTDDLADSRGPLTGCRVLPDGPPFEPSRRIATRLHDWVDSLDARSPTAAVRIADAVSDGDGRWLCDLAAQFDRVAPLLANAVGRFEIERGHLHELVRGAEWDLREHVSVADEDELRHYCHLVACSVGLICVRIWRGDDAACEAEAVAAGYAFQLTNILRDVAEDAKRGRIYLPADQMAVYGCDAASWLRCEPAGDWRGLMRRFVLQAQEYYENAAGLLPHLPPDGQRMFSLMCTTNRELLRQVDAELDRVWIASIRLPKRRKVQIYLAHAFTPWFERSLRSKIRDATAAP